MKIKTIIKKTYTNASETFPLALRIANDGVRKVIALNIAVPKKFFDEKKGEVKKGFPNYDLINATISKKINDITENYLLAKANGNKINLDNLFIKEQETNKTIYLKDFVQNYVAKNKQINSHKTTTRLLYTLNKIEQYQAGIKLKDIDIQFVAGFENYVCGFGYKDNYVVKLVGYFKNILGIAFDYGLIKKNVAKIYKTKTKKTDTIKNFLEVEDLKKIEDRLEDMGHSECTVAKWFLLSCWSGLRYSDIANFDFDKYVKSNELILRTEKTGSIVSIPLNKNLNKALERCKNIKRLISSQKTNERLKLISVHCGIDKNISFHTARHTFACICASLGISIEVTQKWLGHSDTKTTLVYYKLKNKKMTEFAHLFNAL